MAVSEYVNQVLGNDAANLASNGISAAESRAASAVSNANDALDELGNRSTYFQVNIPDNINSVDTTAPIAQFPDAPVAPDLNLVLPNFPSDISFAAPPNISVGAAPEFTGVAPTLNFPDAPVVTEPTSPGDAPAIDLNIPIPDAPVVTLPAVPTLRDLNLPTVPTLNLPAFTAELPTSSLVAPGSTFNWSEDPYTSDKLDLICSVLVERVGSDTGLPANVETLIWDRGRNKEQLALNKARDEILRDEAQLGYSRPTGSTQAALAQATYEFQRKVSELNRQVSISQAELNQKNLQHAIDSIINLESILIGHYNNVQQRALEAMQFVQSTALEIYNAEASLFNLELEKYKAFSLAFEAQLRLEIQKVEIFKAELEAQGLISELNKSDIELYLARIEGIKSNVDIYREQLRGVEARVDLETSRLTAYKTEVEAFTSRIQANAVQFQAYESGVKAEASKSDAFESEAKAFSARITAYASEVDVEKSKADLVIRGEQLRLQQQGLKLDTFARTVGAKVEAFRADAETFRAKAGMYSAEVQTEGVRMETELRIIDQKINVASSKTQIAVANANLFIKNMEINSNLSLERSKAIAQVAAQLASSSLSGLSYSARVGHDLQVNNNLQEQHSFSGI